MAQDRKPAGVGIGYVPASSYTLDLCSRAVDNVFKWEKLGITCLWALLDFQVFNNFSVSKCWLMGQNSSKPPLKKVKYDFCMLNTFKRRVTVSEKTQINQNKSSTDNMNSDCSLRVSSEAC